jgi:DNA-binding CsgD family transcriptional regulator
MAPETPAVPILGRDRETAAITDRLQAGWSAMRVIGIVGEAGIGKTRLWQAALSEAERLGMRRLWCRPNEAEAALPYAGLDDLLRDLPPDVFDALAAPLRHALDVALLRADPAGEPVAQRAIAMAVYEALRTLARRGPLLLAIDDVQWLDPPTAFVLRFSLRRLQRDPLVVLTAIRSGRREALPLGLDRVLVEDRGLVLDLSPLEAHVLGQLVVSRFGLHLAPSRLRALHHQSGGNPLFALELARASMSRGSGATIDRFVPVPDSLQEMLSVRLERLPDSVRCLLGVTAALARPTVGLLRATVDPHGDLDALLQSAVVAGVLELDAERVAFTHPLLASVVYDGLRHDERRRLHRRLAAVVAEPEERARHCALAAEGPDAHVADQLERAVARARARGAPDTAAQLAELARRLTPAGRPGAARRRAMVAAENHLNAGDTPRARQVLADLAATVPSGRDRAPVWRLLAQVCSYDEGHASAMPLLRAALAEAGDDVELRAHLERDLTASIVQAGDVRDAVPHARAALEAAEAVGSPHLLVPAFATVAMVDFLVGRGLRTDLLERATALDAGDDRPGTPSAFLPVELIWGVLLKWADEFAQARDHLERVRQRATRLAEESSWGSLLFQLGELELWAGNTEAAQACADAVEEITNRSGQSAQQSHAAYLHAAVAAQRGELSRARQAAQGAFAEADRVGDRRFRLRARTLLGSIEACDANPHGALAHLLPAAEEHAEAGYGDPGIIRFQPELIEAHIRTGQLVRAEQLIASQESEGVALARPRVIALTLRCRGLLLSTRGDIPAARASLEQAVEAFEPLPHPLDLGRSLMALGATRRRLREKRSAREALDRAIDIFTALDARPFAEQAQAERRRIAGRATVATLTPTEQQIADLVVQGYTNAEVARELFLSVKTVENTLTRVYRKLGLRSRRELAHRYRIGHDAGHPSLPGSDGRATERPRPASTAPEVAT